jgi:spore coat polysaccharide biosynthesis protein SpsF
VSRSVCIIQARTASTRLPRKILEKVGGRLVLERVLERAKAIPGVDVVCCATTIEPADGEIAVLAESLGAYVFRGSESDVLDRYYRAALELEAETVLRVTSDCPLIDPAICGEVLAPVLAGEADFAVNNMPPSWPHGLDCEAFTFSLLERAAREATDPLEREHVGLFMRRAMDIIKVNIPAPCTGMEKHRWTLDTKEDLAFMKMIFERLEEGEAQWSYDVPLALVEADPTLAAINAGQIHPALDENIISR